MLRRITLSLLVLAVILFGLAPAAIGLVLSRAYPDMIANLDHSLSAVGLEVTRVEGGWFTSMAHGKLTGTQDGTGFWQDTVAHGPVPWRLENRMPAWVGGQVQFEHPENDAKGAAEYRVNLDGSVEVQTRLERLGDPFADLQSGPLSIRTLIRKGQESIDLNLQSQSLRFSNSWLSELAGSMLHARLDKRPTGFWHMDLSAQIARSGMTLPEPLSAEDLDIRVQTTTEQGLAKLSLDLTAARSEFSAAPYTEIEGRLTLSNLDEAALGAVLKKMGRGGDKATRDAAVLGEILAQAPILLGAQPHLQISDLSLQSPSGPVAGELDLKLVDPDTRQLAEPIYLLAYLKGELKWAMPESFAQTWIKKRILANTPMAAGSPELIDAAVMQRLGEYVDRGWLVREGPTLTTQISFDSGTAIVNGQSIPLPAPG